MSAARLSDGQVVIFCHSLLSDWNHGNAHFLRGIVAELKARGLDVVVYEPCHNWSLQNLLADRGASPVEDFYRVYPNLDSVFYEPALLRLDKVLANARLVLVHEWNDHTLVRRIGQHRRDNPHYRLLFHDTHHRSVTDRSGMAAYDLSGYDGVLAFGQIICDLYLKEGWTRRAWTWHEAADVRVFHPMKREGKRGRGGEEETGGQGTGNGEQGTEQRTNGNAGSEAFSPLPLLSSSPPLPLSPSGDLVWVGNWGDEERTAELHEFLIEPVKALGLKAKVYGVRYPDHAQKALASAGIEYGGWLPNVFAPEVFGRYRLTVHVPRGPYTRSLPGIPTIRVFEALACGIPLVCSPWSDAEHLFTPGEDYLVAQNGQQMQTHLRWLLDNPDKAQAQAQRGLQTILARHTCAHRVNELLGIYEALSVER